MPRLSSWARSASITGPRLHSSTKAASFLSDRAACAASGCSAATAQKVAPIRVSARVVNTRRIFFSRSSSYGKPMERGEMLLGVGGDPHIVHRHLALLD